MLTLSFPRDADSSHAQTNAYHPPASQPPVLQHGVLDLYQIFLLFPILDLESLLLHDHLSLESSGPITHFLKKCKFTCRKRGRSYLNIIVYLPLSMTSTKLEIKANFQLM